MGNVMMMEGSYIYGGALVTITQVNVTPDMSECKIYLSIYNAKDKDEVLASIRRNTPILKKNLSSRIRNHVRRIPKIHFYIDETLDEASRLDKLLAGLNPSNESREEE